MKIYQHYSVYGFSNGYVVCNEESMEALLVDPGEVTTTMIDQIENKAYSLKAALITHSHIHHCRDSKLSCASTIGRLCFEYEALQYCL